MMEPSPLDQIKIMLNAGMEVHNTNIRIWIHDQDLAKLEKVVWEGMGHLLIKHTSAHPKIRKFLEAVPRLLNDIKAVHAAGVNGDVDKVADKEFRQQVYLSKDMNGITAFHKAVVNGHRDMADHLMEKTDRACFNVVDRHGRTALHYAAALSEFDDIGMYGWLMNMGYDKAHEDNFNKTADYYVHNSAEVDLSKCTFIPEAPRVQAKTEESGGHSEAVNETEKRGLVSSPKKSPTKRKATAKKGGSKKATSNAIKNEKALFNMNPKSVTSETIAKAVKAGNVEHLEIATLMGKGKMLLAKASWNDAARVFIKSVPLVLEQLDTLFNSVNNGDLEAFKSTLEHNSKYVFARDSNGRTPLHIAAEKGHLDIVRHILGVNAEYTQILDTFGRTLLHYASRVPKENLRNEILTEGIMNGADKFARDAFGNDADFYVKHDFPKTAGGGGTTNAVNGKANGNLSDDVFEESPANVEKAVQQKDFDKMVKYVLEGESDKLVDQSSDDEEVQEFIKNIPAFQEKIEKIHSAVEEGSLSSLQTLLNRKKYAMAREKSTGASILHKAIIYGHTEIVNFLSGTFPNTLNMKDRMGRTPLHYAAMCNDGGQYFELLKQHGGDLTMLDSNGNTPDYYASNKTDIDFNDLIDFVEKRKAMPTDSGRSSSMSLSSNLAGKA